jgi:hypothetical protein
MVTVCDSLSLASLFYFTKRASHWRSDIQITSFPTSLVSFAHEQLYRRLNMAATMDLQSELAILQLLEDDVRAVSLAEDARKINIELLTPSVSDTESVHSLIESPWDGDITLGLTAADEQIARDQAFAELLQSQEASLAVSRQYAQKLAAAEQKLRIDSEFARKLQNRTDDAADADR